MLDDDLCQQKSNSDPFHGGNTGSNPVGDANFKALIVKELMLLKRLPSGGLFCA
jgi:hypothetical protein